MIPLHHQRFLLRQWIEHKDAANLRLHAWTNAVAWLCLATALSQVPLAGADLGAWFVASSVLYWLASDALTAWLVSLFSASWAAVTPWWGPGALGAGGVGLLVATYTAMGLTALYAHIYHHEHAAYLKGEPRARAALETAHAVIFGPFHFWLFALLRAGWRPRLRAHLDAAERAAILRRSDVPWSNWAGTASCRAATVCVPLDVDDLVDAVRDAARAGRRVRVVGAGFSWSSCVPTDDVLIFTERLTGIEVDPARRLVRVEAGVTNRQLNAALEAHGLALPWNVVMETVRVAAYVTMGTHGSGRDTACTGDLVESFEVITGEGERRVLSEATVGPDVMAAARTSLGLFGVTARLTLRCVPAYRVRQVDQKMPVARMLAEAEARVRDHESVELFWFPFNRQGWLRTLDRTEAPATRRSGLWSDFVQHLWLHTVNALADRRARWLTPSLMRLNFLGIAQAERVLPLTEAHHYRRFLEVVRCGCVEVGFKVGPGFANLHEAWRATEALVEEYAARRSYPLNCAVNVRFVGESGGLLSAAYGPGLTCYIEALCVDRSTDWEAFSAELVARWMRIPGALPHWAKEFEHVPGILPLVRERLGERLDRFLAARDTVDPRGMFANRLLAALVGEGPRRQDRAA